MLLALEAGVGVEDFWGLTPHQLAQVLEGHGKRTQRAYELAAWHACHGINVWAKRPVRPAQLLRKRSVISLGDYRSVDDFKRAVAEAKRENGTGT